ncbi:glycosyltransferase family 2 protein [Sporolactobacillus sp. THM7-4]|nr:glycosyltransferase family 2 protein [Sporolactobacillus sp. THM7-4]
MIKISVITPMYNVEDIIIETLESLYQQTLSDVEYILIDDGSTDHTVKVVETYLKNKSGFKLIKQENMGQASARNKGLSISKGEYITFVDSDDKLAPQALEIMYKEAKKNNADLVTGAIKRFNSKESWYINSHVKSSIYTQGVKNIYKNPELFVAIGPWGKLYKRSLLKNISFPELIKFAEDQPVVFHAYINANKIYTTNKLVYLYRERRKE